MSSSHLPTLSLCLIEFSIFMATDFLDFTHLLANAPAIELPDYMAFNEAALGELPPQVMAGNCDPGSSGLSSCAMACEREVKRMKKDAGHRIGFRTKSEVEILDDGFKWRKYGKKSVKNSPNLRNYYRCSSEGCGVKKRVERDREDPCYVITTYEGVHNHPSPSTICCSFGAHHQAAASGWGSFFRGQMQMPVMAPSIPWSFVQSANSSC